jgi:hypothetical protein
MAHFYAREDAQLSTHAQDMVDALVIAEDVSVMRAGQARTAPSASRISMGLPLARKNAHRLEIAQVTADVQGRGNASA